MYVYVCMYATQPYNQTGAWCTSCPLFHTLSIPVTLRFCLYTFRYIYILPTHTSLHTHTHTLTYFFSRSRSLARARTHFLSLSRIRVCFLFSHFLSTSVSLFRWPYLSLYTSHINIWFTYVCDSHMYMYSIRLVILFASLSLSLALLFLHIESKQGVPLCLSVLFRAHTYPSSPPYVQKLHYPLHHYSTGTGTSCIYFHTYQVSIHIHWHIIHFFFWWVLQHCTGFARLVWGRLRV